MNPITAPIYCTAFGSHSERVEVPNIINRAPTSQDIRYPLGKRWINPLTNSVYTLISFSFSGLTKTANWGNLTASGITLDSAGITNPLSAQNTPITAPGVIPSDIIFISYLNLEGTIAPVGVTSVGTNQFIIFSQNSSNQSTFYYISAT